MLVLTGPAEAFGVCRECQPRMRTSLHVNAGVCPYKVGAPYKPGKCSYKVLALFECHCEPQQHLKEQRGHITNLPMNHHLVCMTGLVRLSRTPLHHSIHSPRVVLPLQVLRCMSMVAKPRFFPSRLDGTENVEKYRPGGFHPIALGEEFAHGRYRVIHKLGKGSFSTIWMARDQQKESGKLVALKALRADVSFKPPNETPELVVPRSFKAAFSDSGGNYQTIEDHFVVRGPNGTHLFLISPLAGGPSVSAMLDCPGRVSGSRRLRGDLGRKVAKQTANAIYRMHSAGWVHGSKLSNSLFLVVTNE